MIMNKQILWFCLAGAMLVSVGIGIGYNLGKYQVAVDRGHKVDQPQIRTAQRQKRSIDIALNSAPQRAQVSNRKKRNTNSYCEVSCCVNQSVVLGSKKTPFDPLTFKEMDAVFDAMKKNYHLTLVNANKGQTPTINNAYIYSMIPVLDKKQEVVKYLKTGRNFPKRYAHVQVTRPTANPPDVMFYKVGPLHNLTVPLRVEPLTKPGELHYNTRVTGAPDSKASNAVMENELKKLKPLLEESFDGAYYGNGMDWFTGGPAGLRSTDRVLQYGAGLSVPGVSDCCWGHLIHRMPLEFALNITPFDTDQWRLESFFYLNQGPFDSAEELLEAYQNDELDKFRLPKGYRQTLFNKTVGRERETGKRPLSDLPPPITYEPAGPRYRMDGHTVYWMGWEFTVSSNQLRGPSLHNIKFQGESIIYENSFSDMAVIYAAPSQLISNAALFDGAFGFGSYRDLMPGVDCPTYATFMDNYHWDSYTQRPAKAKGSCIFEADGQEPLWRRKGGYSGGMNNNYLVIRFITVLANYDYITEFLFYLDGTMQNKMKSTGNIITDWWDEDNKFVIGCDKRNLFGYKVSEFNMGAIHDHTFAFKVDFDLLGTKNSFETIEWKAGDTVEALKLHNPRVKSKPPYIYFNQTRYLQYNNIYEESAYKISMEKPKFYIVYNENERNQWGVKRGYRIAHMATGAQVLPDSHPNMEPQSFTKKHLWVTRFHDEERYVTGWNDQFRVSDPLFSLEKTVNGESINNKDLVTWVVCSFLHVPTSEHYPLTPREEAGFSMKPFNFFSETKALDMPQYINHTFENGTAGLQERPPSVTSCSAA